MRRRTRHLADARSSRFATHSGLIAEPASSRVLAILCVLLITLGACVQASHVHDSGGPAPWKTSRNSQQNGPGSTPTSPPDHCLICVAMHAAMPSEQSVAPVPIRQIQQATSVALLPRRIHRVSFDMFSRPPPSALAQAHAAGQTGDLPAL